MVLLGSVLLTSRPTPPEATATIVLGLAPEEEPLWLMPVGRRRG
jgi:hypothetical protein